MIDDNYFFEIVKHNFWPGQFCQADQGENRHFTFSIWSIYLVFGVFGTTPKPIKARCNDAEEKTKKKVFNQLKSAKKFNL